MSGHQGRPDSGSARRVSWVMVGTLVLIVASMYMFSGDARTTAVTCALILGMAAIAFV